MGKREILEGDDYPEKTGMLMADLRYLHRALRLIRDDVNEAYVDYVDRAIKETDYIVPKELS